MQSCICEHDLCRRQQRASSADFYIFIYAICPLFLYLLRPISFPLLGILHLKVYVFAFSMSVPFRPMLYWIQHQQQKTVSHFRLVIMVYSLKTPLRYFKEILNVVCRRHTSNCTQQSALSRAFILNLSICVLAEYSPVALLLILLEVLHTICPRSTRMLDISLFTVLNRVTTM